jgi:prepilin-type N-terminal cleavage/methylation domain-containing protein
MATRSQFPKGVTLIEFLFGIAIVTGVFAVAYLALR